MLTAWRWWWLLLLYTLSRSGSTNSGRSGGPSYNVARTSRIVALYTRSYSDVQHAFEYITRRLANRLSERRMWRYRIKNWSAPSQPFVEDLTLCLLNFPVVITRKYVNSPNKRISDWPYGQFYDYTKLTGETTLRYIYLPARELCKKKRA